MFVELGAIKFEKQKLLKQFRNDLKDDWFPDPFHFDDMLDHGIVGDCIAANFEINHGRYEPFDRTLFNVPKANYTLRYALETGVSDRVLYHGLTSFLVPYFDDLIPWFVFSHRRDQHNPSDRYMFRRSIGAWKDFIGSVKTQVTPDKYLLSTDLTNYFENIDIDLLYKTFLSSLGDVKGTPGQKNELRAHLSVLFGCLRSWSLNGKRGLPQNRDASSFLANMYMLPIDQGMQQRGYNYYRYMDDIKVVCADAFEARRALKELSILLRDRGLAVNSKKTILCSGGEKEKINQCLETGTYETEYLDALWSTRTREPILRSLPMLKDYTAKLIDEGKFDTREFRFCIYRLALLGLCREFSLPSGYFDSLTALIVDAIPHYPACTDQFVKYLAAVTVSDIELQKIAHYLSDGRISFYEWQNYGLWNLLARKKFQSPALVALARDKIGGAPDDASRAGATLYCGVMGQTADRQLIAERFKETKSFLGQRCGIIACHELPYKPFILNHIKPHVRDDLKGVYRNLNQKKGNYFSPLEATSINQIIDLERDYD